MNIFFRSIAAIKVFRARLKLICCPSCGAHETLVCHGYILWWKSPTESGIRAWRIRCKKSPLRPGCGYTWSIRLGSTLPRRCFATQELWSFFLELLKGGSIKAAWERCPIRLSLDSGYRIYKRLILCQSVLRTRLCSRAPPPKEKAGAPWHQMLLHLTLTFGCSDPIRHYQESFQKSFLAIA